MNATAADQGLQAVATLTYEGSIASGTLGTGALAGWSGLAWGLIVASYLLGAVPFGLVIARLFKGVDLREVGSGNIGATNTIRAVGKPLGITAFVLDFAKGWAPVYLFVPLLLPDVAEPMLLRVACGTAAVVGHCFPIYLRFRGGKGVATGCGAITGVDPMVCVIGTVVWLVTIKGLRFVGLASMTMGLSFPISAWVLHRDERSFIAGAGLLTLLILVRHRANIARMLAGTEPRTGGPRASSPELADSTGSATTKPDSSPTSR